jgi:hypothetical protein
VFIRLPEEDLSPTVATPIEFP